MRVDSHGSTSSPSPRRFASPSHAQSEMASSQPRAPSLSGNPSVLVSVSHRSESQRSDTHHSVSCHQAEREFRRKLRQIVLSIARAKKRPIVDDKARVEAAFPMGYPPPSPRPPLHRGPVIQRLHCLPRCRPR